MTEQERAQLEAWVTETNKRLKPLGIYAVIPQDFQICSIPRITMPKRDEDFSIMPKWDDREVPLQDTPFYFKGKQQ